MACIYHFNGKEYTREEFKNLVREKLLSKGGVEDEVAKKAEERAFKTELHINRKSNYSLAEVKSLYSRNKLYNAKYGVSNGIDFKQRGQADIYDIERINISLKPTDRLAQIDREISHLDPDLAADNDKLAALKEEQNRLKGGQLELFQKETTSEPLESLELRLNGYLASIGVDVKRMNEIRDKEGNIVDAIAKADFLRRTVEVIWDRRGKDTLAEEAAHFFPAILGEDHPLYKDMYDRIERTTEWNEVLSQYGNTYVNADGTPDMERLKAEAIGKVITNELLALHEGKKEMPVGRADQYKKSWFKKVWDYIVNLFNKTDVNTALEQLRDPYTIAAGDILKQGDEYNASDEHGDREIPDILTNVVHPELFQKLPRTASVEQQLEKFGQDHKTIEKIVDKEGREKLVDPTETDPNKKEIKDITRATWDKNKRLISKPKANDTADTKVKRDASTNLHGVSDNVMMKLVGEDSSGLINSDALFNGRGIARTTVSWEDMSSQSQKEANIEGKHFDEIKTHFKNLVDHIKGIQEKINKDSQTIGKVTILPSQVVMDGQRGTGGNVDVLAIFSDGSRAIYDVDFITPYKDALTKDNFTGTQVLIKNPVSESGYHNYHMRGSEFQRVLNNSYGENITRENRVLPIMVLFDVKSGSDPTSAVGSRLTSKIKQVTANMLDDAILKPITVAFEKVGEKGLDRLMSDLYNKTIAIEEKLKKSSGKEYHALQQQLAEMRNATGRLALKKDLTGVISQALGHITKLIGKDGINGSLGIEDEKHSDYISNEQLKNYNDLMKIYKNAFILSREHLKALKNSSDPEDQASYETLNPLINLISSKAGEALSLIEEKWTDRALEIRIREGAKGEAVRMGPLESYIKTLSEHDNPSFQAFWSMYSTGLNGVRLSLREVAKTIKFAESGLSDWAKRKGISLQEAFDSYIIDPKTVNRMSELNEKFRQDRKDANTKHNTGWSKEHYEPKPNYAADYAKERDEVLKYITDMNPVIDGLVTKSQSDRMIAEQMDEWERNNDLVNHNDAWHSPSGWRWLQLKQSTYQKPEYQTEQYKFMLKPENKAVLDYYNMYQKHIDMAREMLNLGKDDIPYNFLPNIRKDMIEKLMTGGINIISELKEFGDSMKMREYDDVVGSIDRETGERHHEIPIYFTNEIMDRDGKRDPDAKSRNITKSLYIFTRMALMHDAMHKIEGDVNCLYEALLLNKEGELIKDTRGRIKETETGDPQKSFVEGQRRSTEVFEALRDYYFYGVKMRDKGYTLPGGWY